MFGGVPWLSEPILLFLSKSSRQAAGGGWGCSFRAKSGRSVWLTTNFSLVPSLKLVELYFHDPMFLRSVYRDIFTSPSTHPTVVSTYMWTDWLRKCNQQYKAAEGPFFASYWNSGSRKPRVTQGVAKQLSRAHALSGTIWPSPNTHIECKNAIPLSLVRCRLLRRTFLLTPPA